VRATRESQLLEIKREAMAALLQEDPSLLESFSQLVSQRQAEINNLESEAAAAQQQDLIERMRRLFSGWMH
jgi:CRP-like cAMP-binding protein